MAPIDSGAKREAQNIEKVATPLFNVTNIFAKVDTNNNGAGLAEINRAVQGMQPHTSNPASDNLYTLPLVVLKNCRQELKALHDDGIEDKKRISPQDKEQFKKIPEAVAMRMLARSAPILRELDTNHDSWISKDEIAKTLPQNPISSLDKAKHALLKNFDQISTIGKTQYYPGYIHMAEFAEQVDQLLQAQLTPQQLNLAFKAEWCIKDASERLSANNDKIFADQKKDPQPDAPKQNSTVGDCGPLASFCSQAAKDPALIKSLIKENPDGKTLTVTLPFKVDGQLSLSELQTYFQKLLIPKNS